MELSVYHLSLLYAVTSRTDDWKNKEEHFDFEFSEADISNKCVVIRMNYSDNVMGVVEIAKKVFEGQAEALKKLGYKVHIVHTNAIDLIHVFYTNGNDESLSVKVPINRVEDAIRRYCMKPIFKK